ncbi:MAG: CorA family protein Mg2+ transporter protein [Novosphingobium sp.]|nr:CorA family protein Mg2+ transporter protein [Novosphingobium sp.]
MTDPTNLFPGLMPQGVGPGLIWGFDCAGGLAAPIDTCDGPSEGLRWLHFSLANHGTRAWIDQQTDLPDAVRELLLSPETHQRALIDGGVIGCVFHDFERDFDITSTNRLGPLRIALNAGRIVTARVHPMRCADEVRRKLMGGARVETPADALDLLVSVIAENAAAIGLALSAQVQAAEDALLDGRAPPTTREMIAVRRRLAQLHRMVDGMRRVVQRLEQGPELPDDTASTVEKLAQRLQSIDGDILAAQGQLRLLRDEIEALETQRTNQNLYMLSIITALLLPATLVTGIFGMNTGGLPFAEGPWGTLHATVIAGATAGATYLLLRWLGFMRR